MTRGFRMPSSVFDIIQCLRHHNRQRLLKRRSRHRIDYADWLALNEAIRSPWPTLGALKPRVVIVIDGQQDQALIPACILTLTSLKGQTHPEWSAIVHGLPLRGRDSLTPDDPRVELAPIGDATWPEGVDWCMRLEAGDTLHPKALEWMLQTAIHQKADGVYADHDHRSPNGKRHTPHFKPAWDPDLHLASGYAAAGSLIRLSLCKQIAPRQWQPDATLCQQVLAGHSLQMERLPAVLLHRGPNAPPSQHVRAQWIATMLHENGRTGIGVTLLPCDRGLRIEWPDPAPWPPVSVIIPTKDQLSLLRKCIHSVLALTDYPALQVVVIDNGSKEPATLAYLDELRQHPTCVVIRDDQTFNYSRLNNLGVNHAATGAVLALLNNDVEALEPGWLKEMVRLAMRKEIGCVGARLLYGNRTVQHGGVLLGVSKNWQRQIGIAAHAFKGMRPDELGYMGRAQVTQRFSAVTAACLVVRREVFDRVGGLNEQQLAVAYNDVDFCLRVREAGFSNLWTPHATLLHHESISRGRDVSHEKLMRFQTEADYMLKRWGHVLGDDPAYNPNLTLEHASFELSIPSRSPYSRQ